MEVVTIDKNYIIDVLYAVLCDIYDMYDNNIDVLAYGEWTVNYLADRMLLDETGDIKTLLSDIKDTFEEYSSFENDKGSWAFSVAVDVTDMVIDYIGYEMGRKE